MSSRPETTSQLLLEGDPTVTEEVRLRVRRILAFRGYGIPLDDRRDLEQTVMLQLWQSVAKPDFEPDKLWGFVEVLAARRCIDWLRSRSPPTSELTETIPDPNENPSEAASRRQRQILVREALKTLPDPCRRLIELRITEARPYREIARILGKSEGALRVQMTRCIQRVGRLLRTREEETDLDL